MKNAAERVSFGGLFFDLSARLKLRLTGNDRLRFLNGQITADARKATELSAIEACLLDPKGRLAGHFFLCAQPDSFLIDADPALKEMLPARLERYIIADDVAVEDVSDRLSIFHLMTEREPAFPAAQAIVTSRRFAQSGWDVWVDAAQHDNVSNQLSRDFQFCDSNKAEVMRIEQGIPRWGAELTNEIIPVEANLEERCIDYEKGCYVGQEVISRMKMSGQRNKKLCGLISVENAPLTQGMRLFVTSENDKEAGWTTSAGRSEKLDKEVGLAFVKRGFNAAGTPLKAVASGKEMALSVPVEVVDLPFSQ